jgi:hypothetical protein
VGKPTVIKRLAGFSTAFHNTAFPQNKLKDKKIKRKNRTGKVGG